MAEGLCSFKEQFDDQLQCSVCLEQYTNPKALPCLHSFCLKCIEPIPVAKKDDKYYISCPTCRVDHLLPQGGARNLPNDFNKNKLLELGKNLKLPTTQVPTCAKHKDLLTVYCETCCQVICRDCTISTEHNKHTYYLISECYPKHHRQILDNLELGEQKLANMDTAMTCLTTREKEVKEQGESIKEEINEHTQQLIDSIRQLQTHLTQQVDTIVQQKTQTLATQRQQAQKLHTRLKNCQDTIKHNLKEWTQQQILAQKHAMINEIDMITEHIDPTVFQPIETAQNIDLKMADIIIPEIGTVSSVIYGKATLEVQSCLTKQPSTATLTLQSQDGSPYLLSDPSLISSILSSPGNKHSVKCTVTAQKEPGKYDITFTPSTRRDRLIVQVGGIDVPDSPFNLPVIPIIGLESKPGKVITELNQPQGIAVCNNGDIVVAENSAHCIYVLNTKGVQVRLDKPFLDSPRGVAISIDGHILVTDNHRLQKLTIDGVCVKSVGAKSSGSGQSKFYCPEGIAVHPETGQIFVADALNNRVQVFKKNLTLLSSISLKSFEHISDVALDNEENLYMAESSNHCIVKLNSKGKLVKRFGTKGSAPGQLSYPTSLAIHNNIVYVCDHGNNRLSIFDTSGNFLQCTPSNVKYRFNYVTVDTKLERLLISDTMHNKMYIY